MNARTRLLIGTTADWAASDLVLGSGELVLERAGSLLKMKAGDGATHYSGLPFVTATPTIPPQYLTQDQSDLRYLQLADVVTAATPNKVPRLDGGGLIPSAMVPLPPAIAVTGGPADAGKLIKTSSAGVLDLSFLPPIIATSVGAADAGKLVKTASTGVLDLSFLPPIIATSVGAADAGKLVKTSATGKVDPSLITVTTGTYRGTVDATAAKPAGTFLAGDYYLNTGTGAAHASWGFPAGTNVAPGQQVIFNGTAWDTVQGAAYLPISGGTLTGNLGMKVAPSAWGANLEAIEGPSGALAFSPTPAVLLAQNLYNNGGAWVYKSAGPANLLNINNGGYFFNTAASGAAGATATLTTALALDANGNLGLGVTPSAWAAGQSALQLKGGSLYGANTSFVFGQNLYYDGGVLRYVNAGAASYYQQSAGSHSWASAPSGAAAAGMTPTVEMTLNVAGNLLVGGTTDIGARINASGVGNTQLAVSDTTGYALLRGVNTGGNLYVGTDSAAGTVSGNAYGGLLMTATNTPLALGTNGIVRALLSTGGNLNLSGALQALQLAIIGGGSEAIHLANSAAFISFYDTANAARSGYLQGTPGAVQMIAETGNAIIGSSTGSVLLQTGTGQNRISISPTGVLLDVTNGAEIGWRSMPQNVQGNGYTLAASDRGKHVFITSAGTVNVPSGIFHTGDVVTVVNGTGQAITLAQAGSATLFLAGTGSQGNRTIAVHGVAPILCTSATDSFFVWGNVT